MPSVGALCPQMWGPQQGSLAPGAAPTPAPAFPSATARDRGRGGRISIRPRHWPHGAEPPWPRGSAGHGSSASFQQPRVLCSSPGPALLPRPVVVGQARSSADSRPLLYPEKLSDPRGPRRGWSSSAACPEPTCGLGRQQASAPSEGEFLFAGNCTHASKRGSELFLLRFPSASQQFPQL